MRKYLTPGKTLHRFAGVAVAAGTLAAIGLAPAASAQVATPRIAGPAPASAAAAASPALASAAGPPSSSQCYWVVLPPSPFIGDPSAVYPILGGVYNRPGNTGVAYKLTGKFVHSTTMTFTAYNNLVATSELTPDNVLNDSSIIPDPGSVNPFVPGNLVDAPNRNYTAWLWPEGVPVPKGLHNVVMYPTKSANPRLKTAGWSVTMRIYHMQPGYSARAEVPQIHAVSAADPSRYVRCPLNPARYYPDLAVFYAGNFRFYGGAGAPPEPVTGDTVYFTKYPAKMTAAGESVSTDGCSSYIAATLPLNKITVVTVHKVPTYFNNDHVTPSTVMGKYQVRFMSQTAVGYITTPARYAASSVNTDDAVYRSNGQWVTVYLPDRPVLTQAQLRRVRAVARVLGYNVIQLRIHSPGPIGRTVPPGSVYIRQKAVNPTFRYGIPSMPCWANPKTGNNYRDYPYQTSAAFFRQYASSPRTMGAYWVGGVWYDVSQFLARFSK